MAQERERREQERKRDYRLQIQQRNLGVRARVQCVWGSGWGGCLPACLSVWPVWVGLGGKSVVGMLPHA